MKFKEISLPVIGVYVMLTSCYSYSLDADSFEKFTYTSCLYNAVSANSSLDIDDIRSLCSEAAQVISPTYEFQDNELVPGNEFTICYDKEKSLLESLGEDKADRLAKLSCKYPDVD